MADVMCPIIEDSIQEEDEEEELEEVTKHAANTLGDIDTKNSG